MKKILVLVLIFSVFLLCACQNGSNNETQPAGSPTESEAGTAEPSEQVSIDWETPIDVDDSFAEETDAATEAPAEPSESNAEATEPLSSEPTEPSVKPTEATDPTEGPTEAPQPTEPVPTKPSGSGPIELPMIPG